MSNAALAAIMPVAGQNLAPTSARQKLKQIVDKTKAQPTSSPSIQSDYTGIPAPKIVHAIPPGRSGQTRSEELEVARQLLHRPRPSTIARPKPKPQRSNAKVILNKVLPSNLTGIYEKLMQAAGKPVDRDLMNCKNCDYKKKAKILQEINKVKPEVVAKILESSRRTNMQKLAAPFN